MINEQLPKVDTDKVVLLTNLIHDALCDVMDQGDFPEQFKGVEFELATICALKTWQRTCFDFSPPYKLWFPEAEANFDRFMKQVESEAKSNE